MFHRKPIKQVKGSAYVHGVKYARIHEKKFSRRNGDSTTNPEVRQAVLRKTGGRCYLCHRKYTENERQARLLPRLFFNHLHIDHVVPVSAHGANMTVNYLPTCSTCNMRKGAHNLATYRSIMARRKR